MKEEEKFENAFLVIAHELRNVIGEFYTLADFLQQEECEKEELKKYLLYMKSKAHEAVNFLTEIFEWAKEKNLTPELSSFDVESEIYRTVKDFSIPLQQKAISVEIALEKKDVFSDRRIFSVILKNLFSNAVKFTPFGGNIYISVKKDILGVCFFIMNNIEKDQRSNISIENFFDIARRQGRGTNGERGTGLGLFLAKKFSDMLGWKAEVSQSEGKLCVSFFIPSELKN